MRRMGFERPTEHYDKRIETIDEQLCALVKQRKEMSNNNPGFPANERISTWAREYQFDEAFLNGLFGHLFTEYLYGPVVEPKEFLKNIPVLRSFEKDDLFCMVTFVRQYANASVVSLTIDRDASEDIQGEFVHHDFFELSVEDQKGTDYTCRSDGGGGSGGHMAYSYIVSPSLPDDLSMVTFLFKKEKAPFGSKATPFEFVITVE